jgi:hypothetical protein
MNFEKYPISQSLIKKFLHNGSDREFCARKIGMVDIFHHYEIEQTDPMIKGKFFETLCIGRSRGGETILDLPRKKLNKIQETENRVLLKNGKPPKKGEKTADQIRIEEQVQRFKALCTKYQVIVLEENTQVQLAVHWEKNTDVILSMEMDIFPTPLLLDNELNAAIIDLKLTADIHSTYGEYCYGDIHNLDLIQGKMYHYGARQLDKELNPHVDNIMTESLQNLIKDNKLLFVLWVFNYKKATLEDKFIKIHWDKSKEAELHESIRKTVALIEMYDDPIIVFVKSVR